MKRWMGMVLLLVVGLTVPARGEVDLPHRFGVGVHYWTVLDDVELDDFEDEGLAWLVTYQYRMTRVARLELDLEIMPEDFGGSDRRVMAPQAYLVIGSGLYIGAGGGLYVSGGDLSEDTFMALRAGLDAEVLPTVYLDINVNYRFEDWDDINDRESDVDTDTMTLGAALRLAF